MFYVSMFKHLDNFIVGVNSFSPKTSPTQRIVNGFIYSVGLGRYRKSGDYYYSIGHIKLRESFRILYTMCVLGSAKSIRNTYMCVACVLDLIMMKFVVWYTWKKKAITQQFYWTQNDLHQIEWLVWLQKVSTN